MLILIIAKIWRLWLALKWELKHNYYHNERNPFTTPIHDDGKPVTPENPRSRKCRLFCVYPTIEFAAGYGKAWHCANCGHRDTEETDIVHIIKAVGIVAVVFLGFVITLYLIISAIAPSAS